MSNQDNETSAANAASAADEIGKAPYVSLATFRAKRTPSGSGVVCLHFGYRSQARNARTPRRRTFSIPSPHSVHGVVRSASLTSFSGSPVASHAIVFVHAG